MESIDYKFCILYIQNVVFFYTNCIYYDDETSQLKVRNRKEIEYSNNLQRRVKLKSNRGIGSADLDSVESG